MSARSAARRLREIAQTIRALPITLKGFGAAEIASRAGELLDEAIQFGAFPADARPEYARLRELIVRQKRMAAQSPHDGLFGPYDWQTGAWDKAVTCLVPELRAVGLGIAWRDACGPIADLIDKPRKKRGPKGPRHDPTKDREVYDDWLTWRPAGGKRSIEKYAQEKHRAETRQGILKIARTIERERKRRRRKGQK
jgi:hypothetical protein